MISDLKSFFSLQIMKRSPINKYSDRWKYMELEDVMIQIFFDAIGTEFHFFHVLLLHQHVRVRLTVRFQRRSCMSMLVWGADMNEDGSAIHTTLAFKNVVAPLNYHAATPKDNVREWEGGCWSAPNEFSLHHGCESHQLGAYVVSGHENAFYMDYNNV